jgi:hypothetical protein
MLGYSRQDGAHGTSAEVGRVEKDASSEREATSTWSSTGQDEVSVIALEVTYRQWKSESRRRLR